jgi:hypothetical protein
MKKILRVLFMSIPILLSAGNLDIQKYYDEFPNYILTPVNLMEMKHEFVVEKMQYIHKLNSHIIFEEVGRSVEGRSINMFSFGSGKTKLLLWSQMHGDEATATAGLLSIFYFFAQNFTSPIVQSIYNNLSIHAIVMLNPDGSERYQRRNVQGIDINRDAQRLTSPESQVLKKMNARIKPDFGFNLHDMRGRETVGESGELLSTALMAPPYNKANEDSPTRIRAKKLAVIVKKALDTFIEGHIARYKADYMPRAFGDAFQNWGVSTILIESGLPNTTEPHYLTRLSFISLLAAFDAISEEYIDEVDPGEYELIPLEGIQLFDLLIENALIYNGKNIIPFKGDIGINISEKWKNNKTVLNGIIEDLGDLSITSGRTVIRSDNLVVIPGLISKSDDSPEDLLQYGVTTPIKTNDPMATKLSSVTREGTLTPGEISSYTMESARSLNLDGKGIIDIDMIADLLVFESTDHDKLSLNDLKYVIRNGDIVYTNKYEVRSKK